MLPIESSEIREILFGKIKSFTIFFTKIFLCFMYFYGINYFSPDIQNPKLVIAEDFYNNIYKEKNTYRIDEFCLKYNECEIIDEEYYYSGWKNKKLLDSITVNVDGITIKINDKNEVFVDNKKHSNEFFYVGTQIFFYYVYVISFTIILAASASCIIDTYKEIGEKDTTPPYSKFKNNWYIYSFFLFFIIIFFAICYINKNYFIIDEYEFYADIYINFYRNIIFYYTIGFFVTVLLMINVYDEIKGKIDKRLKKDGKPKLCNN